MARIESTLSRVLNRNGIFGRLQRRMAQREADRFWSGP